MSSSLNLTLKEKLTFLKQCWKVITFVCYWHLKLCCRRLVQKKYNVNMYVLPTISVGMLCKCIKMILLLTTPMTLLSSGKLFSDPKKETTESLMSAQTASILHKIYRDFRDIRIYVMMITVRFWRSPVSNVRPYTCSDCNVFNGRPYSAYTYFYNIFDTIQL